MIVALDAAVVELPVTGEKSGKLVLNCNVYKSPAGTGSVHVAVNSLVPAVTYAKPVGILASKVRVEPSTKYAVLILL